MGTLGILTDINMLIWEWGIYVGVPFLLSVWITLIGGAFSGANDKFRQKLNSSTTLMYTQMTSDIVLTIAMSAWAGGAISAEYGAWH